jgi:hypothetical protein
VKEGEMKRNVRTIDRLIPTFVVAPATIVWAGLAGWTRVLATVAL